MESSRQAAAESLAAADKQRRADDQMRFFSMLQALKSEVQFNVAVLEREKDRKLIGFAATAWEDCQQYLGRIDGVAGALLLEAYACAPIHAQRVPVELQRTGFGQQPEHYSGIALSNFKKALIVGSWERKAAG